MLRAVVFDVDGTLVDSERDGHRVAFNEAFASHGLPYHWGEEEYGVLLATTGGERRVREYLVRQGHPEEEAAQLATAVHGRKTEVFRELCQRGEISPRPGVERLLDGLEERGVTLAVATTGTRAWVQPLLDRVFGRDRFAPVLTGDEVPRRKPEPDVYLETLRAVALDPDEVVAVEDSAGGLAAARAAGLTCLVVTNDYTACEDFAEAALVVDAFGGPGWSRALSGPADTLEAGAVVPATLTSLLDLRARGSLPERRSNR